MATEIKTIGVLTSGGDAPGMNAAIRANSRTADAARISGMHRALALAFSGGSVI